MLKRNCMHWLAAMVVLVVSFLPRATHAQVGLGVLTGTVVDTTDKKPVADAVVTATSPAAQGEQVVVTDSAGLYRIPSLPGGKYTIRVDKETFKPFVRDGIMLRADSTIRVNVELLPESLKGDQVTVVARPPTVDVGSSTTSTSISSEFTSRIPVARPGAKGAASRSFESVAEVAPGAHNDTYGTSISGTTSPENQYVLDGMSVNNPAYGIVGTPLSVEFVKEVNVISGGYMPEYGRATGGVLTVVTKSGSNEFHGSVFGYYTPGALEGRRALVKREGTTIQAEQSLAGIGDVGADIGGPIIKDKLWFYAGFDVARSRYNLKRTFNRRVVQDNAFVKDADGLTVTERIPGTEQSWPAYSQNIQAMGKLTFAINPDHQVALSVYVTPSTSGGRNAFSIDPRNGLPEVTPTTNILGEPDTLGHVRTYNPIDVNLKFTDAFMNKRVMLDTTLGWHHESNSVLASDGTRPSSFQGLSNVPRVLWRRTNSHPLTDFYPDAPMGPGGCEMVPITNPTTGMMTPTTTCPVVTYNTGGPAGLAEAQLNRYQGRSVLTVLLQGAGHHVIKAGVDVELMRYDNLRAFSGGIGYREATNGNSFTVLNEYGFIRGADTPFHLDNLHAKTQSITAGGFVQDSWSIMDKVTLNAGLRYDAQFMYNNVGARSLSLPNQWSPRAGLIYDPTQNGRSKLFVNYARFYENVPLDIADRSLSGEAAIQSNVPAGRATVPCSNGSTFGPCADAPKLRSYGPPNRSYRTVGAGPQVIDPNIKPQSSDEIVVGGEYEILRDMRLGLSYSKRWMNSIIEDMSRDEAQTYFLGNPGQGIAIDFPKAERKYDAGTLYLTKVFADDWLAQASYTLAYLRGNYAGLFRPENGQLDPNINSDFDLSSLLANRYGPLPGDRRHQIKVFLARDWRIAAQHYASTGVSGRARSGDPSSYLGGHPVYGSDQAYVLPRGAGERLPWEFSTDLQLGYRFHIDKDKTVQATVDIFNLFNFQAATGRDDRYTVVAVLPSSDGDLSRIKKAGVTCATPGQTECPELYLTPGEVNPNHLRPNAYQPPRIFRFGLRMTF